VPLILLKAPGSVGHLHEMGKDFRIGLMVGLALALVILFWVATRPSLTSQVPAAPGSALSQTDTGGPLPPEGAGPQAGAGRLEPAGRSAPSGNASDTTRPPANPPADAGTQQRGATPARAELVPDSTSGANPAALPDLTIYEKAEKIKTTRFHIVLRGETLAGIARQYYGSPEAWPRILKANQKVIKDANRITPGTKLIIPDAEPAGAAQPKGGPE
jgi:hypothetical protein